MQSSEKKQTTTSDISEIVKRQSEIVRAALQEAARKARQGK